MGKVFAVISFLPPLLQYQDYGPGYHHHWGPMWGMGWGGGVAMMILWVILIVVAVYLLVRFLQRERGAAPHETPLQILQKRYAQGEISKEQYEQMKKDLGG